MPASVTSPRLFIITGGPGSGKTTVLKELERSGHPFMPEAAREIIREQVACGGEALPWADRERYTGLMLERSIQSFLQYAATKQLTFADRGIPDTLCYARLIGLTNEEAIRAACERYRYAQQVFLAPPWKEIYETDAERKQNFDEAVRTYEMMSSVYSECGYQVIELPRATPRERAEFMLGRVMRGRGVG